MYNSLFVNLFTHLYVSLCTSTCLSVNQSSTVISILYMQLLDPLGRNQIGERFLYRISPAKENISLFVYNFTVMNIWLRSNKVLVPEVLWLMKLFTQSSASCTVEIGELGSCVWYVSCSNIQVPLCAWLPLQGCDVSGNAKGGGSSCKNSGLARRISRRWT